MDKIIELTTRIREWNMMGYSLLPELQIVIIIGKIYENILKRILKLFKAMEVEVQCQRNGNKLQQNQIYRVFKMGEPIYGRMHLVLGLSDNEIKDQEFRERKKMIQKLRREKDRIFIVFTNEDKRQLQKNQQYFTEFGLGKGFTFDRVIFYERSYEGISGREDKLVEEIGRKYQRNFRFDLVRSYRLMKEQKKGHEKLLKRYLEWKKVINGEISPLTYGLTRFKFYTEVMSSSFSGTYSSSSNYQLLGVEKSINWIVMELLNDFWPVVSNRLFKVVDSFQLSYIQQKYKMSDYYSIGGFLPDTCFKAIFSSPLYQFKKQLIALIQNIIQQILQHIQRALLYTFDHTSIKQQLLQNQLKNIQQICNKFIDELQNSIDSQIDYIHACSQDYWSYRQLNSNFYSPQKQIYIQIKYIGKAYIKKVYQNVQNMIPKYIGQNLLKKIIKYLTECSINNFMDVMREKELEIVIQKNEVQGFQKCVRVIKELDQMISYFSLKVGVEFLVKNYHGRKEKQWNRMFGKKQKIEKQSQKQLNKQTKKQQKKGFLKWMKNLFTSKKKNKNKRSRSQQKMVEKQQKQEQKQTKNKQNVQMGGMSQKNWLLIINTGREVSSERVKMSAAQGFVSRFRSSIWLYLSTHNKQKLPKVKHLIQQKADNSTVIQIQKDLDRTSPSQLFQHSMRNSLKNVLISYSIYDKQVSYTQGMNFICAIIICTLINYGETTSPLIEQRINYDEIEQKAFCILVHLMNECGIRKLMLVDTQLLSNICIMIHDRIKQYSPTMQQLISDGQFNCQVLFQSSLISSLSNVSKHVNLIKRFFDLIITNGFIVIYKIVSEFVIQCEAIIEEVKKIHAFQFFNKVMYNRIYQTVGEDGITKMFMSF